MRRLPSLLAIVLAIAPGLAAAPRLARAQASVVAGKGGHLDPRAVAQHKRTLAASPHDVTALSSLLELYRRHRTAELLRDEYQQALDRSPDDWATLVVLGRIQRALGDDPRALDCWNRALAQRPADTATWIELGTLHKGAGRHGDARAAYDNALANAPAKDAGLKKRVLRALVDVAFAARDPGTAHAYFKQLVALEPRNARLWIDHGDALLAARRHDLALESYTAAEQLLGRDPVERSVVVARRGQALEGSGMDDAAVGEYRRAMKLAPKGFYIEIELTGRIIDIYRRKQALPRLLAELEQAWPERARSHFEWSTLGRLHDELGAPDKAIAALRKAVAIAEWELDSQRRLIQLLEAAGRDAEALAQYELVARVAPGEVRFQLELAERYWRRGDAKRAGDVLARVRVRFSDDPAVLSAVGDLEQRWRPARP